MEDAQAKFVKEITVDDPNTGGQVKMEVYKHENGGMFAIDSSYLEQVAGKDALFTAIPDPFGPFGETILYLID